MRSTPLTRISLALIAFIGPALIAPAAFAQAPPSPAQPSPSSSQVAPQDPPTSQNEQLQPGASAQNARHAIDPVKARYNVQVMEAVLERAVRYAAGQMNRRLQTVSPDLLQLSGAARARGFRLPGYGVFFDVDVPAALRHTMGWTLRLMQQSDQNVQRALSQIRGSLADMDPKQRQQAEMALKLLETRFQPPPRPRPIGPSLGDQDRPANADAGNGANPAVTGNDATTAAAETVIAASATGAPPSIAPLATASAAGGATAVNTGTPLTTVSTPSPMPSPIESAPAPGEAPPTADDLAWAQNPDLAYEMEVRDALVSAMLEYGSTLSLGPDEYLTIAARDSENVVMPGDLSETVTVLLRIKGSDLFDYKSGRITEADARRRIEVREF